MAILEAMEYQVGRGCSPRRTIYLALGHDEEIGGAQGNGQIAVWMRQQGIRLQWVLDEGGCIFGDVPGISRPVALIGIAEKGHLNVQVVAEAEGGHASLPPRQTAVGILARAISRLEEHPFPRRLDGGAQHMLDFLGPEMPFPQRLAVANRWLFSPLIKRMWGSKPSGDAILRTTAAVTMIEGGVKDNVLPTRAEATVNVRMLPGDSAAGVLASMATIMDDERVRLVPKAAAKEPSPISRVDSENFLLLHTTIRETFPDVWVAPFVITGGTDSVHYRDFLCDIYRFVPARLADSDLARIHGIDERISQDNYLEMIQFYARLIENVSR
jgi:carboxypeptidase PM20D1